MQAPRSMLSLWGGPLAPSDMLMRVLGRLSRSSRCSGAARVISSCGSSAMVEPATLTIIAHHLHQRALTKHENCRPRGGSKSESRRSRGMRPPTGKPQASRTHGTLKALARFALGRYPPPYQSDPATRGRGP